MLSEMRKRLRQVLRTRGLELIRSSTPEQVRGFLELIQPVTTDKRLIRIGGEGDGGYLVPDDLEGVEACFSPGVSTIAAFEEELATRGIRSFLADHSVDAAPVENPLFSFKKKFLGLHDDSVYTRLETWMKDTGPFRSDLVLQMDIEGAEYEVLFDTGLDALSRFRILIIEFHHLDSLLGHPFAVNWLRASFDKVLRLFDIVHIHPNNFATPATVGGYEIPPIMEFSFLRKDRVAKRVATLHFPHALDRPNVPAHPDYPLPKCWFDRGGAAALEQQAGGQLRARVVPGD